MKYHTLFLSKTRKDVGKFVVCCSPSHDLADDSHEIPYFILFEN